jgi:hypothetical protein
MELQVGDKVRFYFNDGNPNNKTVQIRAIVDENKIVVRRWHGFAGWSYWVENQFYFDICEKHGEAKKVKP